MKKFLPKSLVGQMAVLIGAALLLAQLVSFAFVLVQRQDFSRAQIDTPAITRFTSTAADFAQAEEEFKPLVLTDASRRGARYERGRQPAVPQEGRRREDTEDRLRRALELAGVQVLETRAAIDPHPVERRSGRPRRRPAQTMILSAQLPTGDWLNARLIVPGQPPLLTPEIVLGTLLVYLFVLSAAVLIAVRLARPLGNLTRAAEAFRGRNQPVVVEPSGPTDLRNAILAFNAMNERVVELLEEKDRTLGAIGHDLRTPLASLRIRAESVEPEEDRERMIATIEEMTGTLEDILTLAKVGRSREQFERADVSGLVAAVAEEFRELGSQVNFTSDEPHMLDVQPMLLRRAVRNLIDNAIKYAGAAEVEVSGADDRVAISVLDRGPGLTPEELGRVAGAFYRGEPSRNRETGGAGLGLSIAQAVADAHGGSLTIANRAGGGLVASFSLPNG
ncbi:MAG TPA: ATP-binding protein [Sphingomicrobium sp.]|nr:ATP-binding protein [Sphingomicrobium sp.]